MEKQFYTKILTLLFVVVLTFSCGKNIIEELESGKRPSNAIEKLADLIKKDPENIKAQRWMAILELENNDVVAAESRVTMMMIKFPKQHDTFYTACQLYLHKKDTKESTDFCEKALDSDDKRRVNDLHFLGMAHLEAKRFDKALALFDEAHKKLPDNADIINNMGFCEMSLGNYKGAIELFKKAVNVDSGQIKAWKNLARCHFELGSFKNSASTQEEALKHAPKDTEILLNLALINFIHFNDPITGSQYFEMAKKHGLDEGKIKRTQEIIESLKNKKAVPGQNMEN
jgi:tetratricopeptide (TPR) repeat protein